ncbi:MAG: hypothetical protein R3C68_12180 [Myxococcota bacterium]
MSKKGLVVLGGIIMLLCIIAWVVGSSREVDRDGEWHGSQAKDAVEDWDEDENQHDSGQGSDLEGAHDTPSGIVRVEADHPEEEQNDLEEEGVDDESPAVDEQTGHRPAEVGNADTDQEIDQ